MGNVILILLFICVIWYFFFRKEQKIDRHQVSGLKKTEFSAVEDSKKIAEEKLTESLNAMRAAIEEMANTERSDLVKDLNTAKVKLKSATRSSKTLGISPAIANLMKEMQHWHAWSKKTDYDFSKNLVDGLVYISGETKKIDKRYYATINLFTFKNNFYRLSLANEHRGYDSSDIYAEIILENNKDGNFVVVFKADVSQDCSQDFAPWNILQVTNLSLGEWTIDIISLDALILARKEKERLERELEYYNLKAKDLDK